MIAMQEGMTSLERCLATIQSNAVSTQLADTHYIAGLGQLGLDNRDQARQQFLLALKACPDHYAAKTALTGMRP
jgi:hypothetical protein